jgi:hypothetical protein
MKLYKSIFLSLLLAGVYSVAQGQTVTPTTDAAEKEAEGTVTKLLSMKKLSNGPDWSDRANNIIKTGTVVETWAEPVLTLKDAWIKVKPYSVKSLAERRHAVQSIMWNMTQTEALPNMSYKDKHLAAVLLYLFKNYDLWKSPRFQGVLSDCYAAFALHWGEEALIKDPNLIKDYTIFLKTITSKKVEISSAVLLGSARRGLASSRVTSAGQDAMTYYILESWK